MNQNQVLHSTNEAHSGHIMNQEAMLYTYHADSLTANAKG